MEAVEVTQNQTSSYSHSLTRLGVPQVEVVLGLGLALLHGVHLPRRQSRPQRRERHERRPRGRHRRRRLREVGGGVCDQTYFFLSMTVAYSDSHPTMHVVSPG